MTTLLLCALAYLVADNALKHLRGERLSLGEIVGGLLATAALAGLIH
jgi:hypothetical protein